MTRRVAVLAFLLALALGGCGSGPAATKAPPVAGLSLDAVSASHAYPAFVRENFMANCVSRAGGGLGVARARALCRCAYSAVQRRYTLREFIAIDRAGALGHPLPRSFYRLLRDRCLRAPPP